MTYPELGMLVGFGGAFVVTCKAWLRWRKRKTSDVVLEPQRRDTDLGIY